MRLPEESETNFQINIVPMIDVIFAILTFFIMSTLFLTRSEGLPVNLPKAATGQSDRPASVTVTIAKEGEISFNREAIALDDLEGAIRAKAEDNQNLLVVVNADTSVHHGRVVEVMDRVRRVKGAKLAIATARP